MSDIKFPFWQEVRKLLVKKRGGTYAERMDISETALGYGDLTSDAWGVQKISLPLSLFHGMFTFDIPTTQFFMYENGAQVYTSDAITSTNGAGRLLTTETLHTLRLESRVCPRYQPNRGHLFSTALWCPNASADGERQWGVGTEENQVSFVLKSDGLLYAVIKSNGVITHDELIDTSEVVGFDVAKGNVYDIQYQWRGVGNYKFFINLQLVHIVAYLGTLERLSLQNPALPTLVTAKRNTENVEINVGCVDISSENGGTEQLQYASSYAENVSANTNTPILIIRQPLEINTTTNTRDLTLARVSVTSSKKSVFKVWITRDSTAIVGATFAKISDGSFVETDSPDTSPDAVRATSVDITKLKLVTAVPVEAAVPREVTNPWALEIVFPVVRGDYVVITCTGNATISEAVMEWGEHI